MAVIYTTALKNTRLDAVVTAIDAGTAGRLEIMDGATILSQHTLDTTSGTTSGGVLTFSNFPKTDSSANATGTADVARIVTSAGADVVTGLTVGTSSADIILTSVSITSGQSVEITSATITHG
jgi:hypothetical protein